MIDTRDEPAEVDKEDAQNVDRVSHGGGELQFNETALLLNKEWRHPRQTYC